jgi:hypothetical protein
MIDPIPDAFIVNDSFSEKLVISNINRRDKMLLRIVNVGVLSSYRFSIDGLPMTILEIDGTPVKPMLVPDVTLFVAQRVTLLLDWSLMDHSMRIYNAIWFRFRATVNGVWPEDLYYGSGSGKFLDLQWKGVLRFQGESYDQREVTQDLYNGERPQYQDKWLPDISINSSLQHVADMNALSAIPLLDPYIASYPPESDVFHVVINNSIAFEYSTQKVKAFVNGETFPLESLSRDALSDSSVTLSVNSLLSRSHLPLLFNALGYSLSPMGLMAYSPNDANFIRTNLHAKGSQGIRGSGSVPFILPHNRIIELTIFGSCCDHHPFHLHGHTFTIVGSSEVSGSLDQPYMERDVVIVPANGWVKVRFRSDNPGLWLFHCHVHSHMNAGMMALFVEAPEEFSSLLAIPVEHLNLCQQKTHLHDQNSDDSFPLLYRVLSLTSLIFVVILGSTALMLVILRKSNRMALIMTTHERDRQNHGHEMKVLYSSLPTRSQDIIHNDNHLFDDEDEEIWG